MTRRAGSKQFLQIRVVLVSRQGTVAALGCDAFQHAVATKPFIPGIEMSNTTTSGLSTSACSRHRETEVRWD